MQPSTKLTEDQLRDDIYGAMDDVSSALESGEKSKQKGVARVVDPLVTRYNELVANATSASDRDRLERGLGRLLTDLRRKAALLPQHMSGAKAELAADVGQPFLLNRAPSPYLKSQTTDGRAHRTSNALVGKEVDAWCGKCQEVRSHRVVVLSEGKPFKVECQHCKSQHGYRSEASTRSTATACKAR